VQNQGSKQWQADLPAMSMAREVKVDVRSRRLLVDIGGVGEKKPERVRRHFRHCAWQIGAIVIVRIVHANYPQPVIRGTDCNGFVDQHPNADLFQRGRDFSAVVITENSDDSMAGSHGT
jgi:hypothetical protein